VNSWAFMSQQCQQSPANFQSPLTRAPGPTGTGQGQGTEDCH